jgi:hypothetical protein
MTNSQRQLAEKIIDEVRGTIQLGGRVRVYFPGGPIDPLSINYEGDDDFVHLETEPGIFACILTLSLVGWQDLDELDEANQTYIRR